MGDGGESGGDWRKAERTGVLEGGLAPLGLEGEMTGEGAMPEAGEATRRAGVQSDGNFVALDSLGVTVLDGELTGRGSYAADRLSLVLAGSDLDLAPLATEGDLGFELAATVDLLQLRYEADLRARLRGAHLPPQQPADAELAALHPYSRQTQVESQSPAFALPA